MVTERRGERYGPEKESKVGGYCGKTGREHCYGIQCPERKEGRQRRDAGEDYADSRRDGVPQHAAGEKAHKSYIIGVAVAEKYVKEFPSFYMDIYQRIAGEAVKRGHLTVLEVVTPEKEELEKSFEPFLEQKIAGLILIGELKKEYIQAIRKSYDIPIVCVDYYDIYEDLDYIITDGFGGMHSDDRAASGTGI